MKPAYLAAAGLLAAALLAGCTSDTHEDGANVPASAIHDAGKVGVARMPDGFRNVAYGCVNGDLVYVTSAGNDMDTKQASGIVVLPNDPYCSG